MLATQLCDFEGRGVFRCKGSTHGSIALASFGGPAGKLPCPEPRRTGMLNFKGMRFSTDVILVCIRRNGAYPSSHRHLEEMMEVRGMSVDHSSINRWAIRFLRLIEKMARRHKRSVGGSWPMVETCVEVKGTRKYLYRAVDKRDCRLTADGEAWRGLGEAPLRQGHGSKRRSQQSRDGQKRRQQGGHRYDQCWPRRADRGALGQVLQKHRLAGPSCNQTGDHAGAGVQVIPMYSPSYYRR